MTACAWSCCSNPLGPAGADAPGAMVRESDEGRRRRRRRRPPVGRPPGDDRPRRDQHVDARRPCLVPLPVPSGQPAAGVRPGGGDRLPLGPRRPGPRSAGRRARPARCDSSASAERPVPVRTRRAGESPLPEERLARYGPTTGDRVRLGDTDLWVRVAEDRQAPGDEPIWGYAKTLRPSVDPGTRLGPSELDAVVAGALVLDPRPRRDQGGHRDQGRSDRRGRAGRATRRHQRRHRAAHRSAHAADHGLRADRHAGRGRQPRPPDQPGPDAGRAVGWRHDAHHGRLRGAAVGDGADARGDSPTGRSTSASRRAPGPTTTACLEALLDAGRLRLQDPRGLRRLPGAHRPRRSGSPTPTTCHVSLHTDGLHERAELEDTVAAIDGRTVHAYHVEGTGGGHVPDLIGLVREANVICSSTTPTIPFGVTPPPSRSR